MCKSEVRALSVACLAIALLSNVGCREERDEAGNDGSDTDATGDGDGDDPLADALEFVGGEAALTAMTGFQSQATGTRSIAGEGQAAGDPALETGTFTAITNYEFESAAARIDYMRTLGFFGGVEVAYSEIYAGELGYVEGDDSVVVPGPTDAPMLSTRQASGRKQLALLHPHILLREVLAGERTARAGDPIEGCDAVLEVSDAISPIDLCLADGEITRASTMVNDFLLRDVELEVRYAGWAGDPVLFPSEATIILAGEDIHVETRTVVVDPVFDVDFELPDGGTFDASLAETGETTPQFFQSFAALGIAIDAMFLDVVSMELAPGVHFLAGGSHNSLAVEQAQGIVIIEAPNYPERADAILAWAAQTFPSKPVTHVIATHHHEDHSSGLRSFVAAGATVVLHESSEAFFVDRVFAAPSTISPDSLAMNPIAPTTSAVSIAGETLDDPQNPITISHIGTAHCSDMLLIHVGAAGGIVFESDLYNPGNGGSSLDPAYAAQLLMAIQSGPPTAMIAGGHGGVAELAELEQFVN
jgi:glyoxylase-like metal-dependent hydrolase (beta-lactamase superfamily II)